MPLPELPRYGRLPPPPKPPANDVVAELNELLKKQDTSLTGITEFGDLATKDPFREAPNPKRRWYTPWRDSTIEPDIAELRRRREIGEASLGTTKSVNSVPGGKELVEKHTPQAQRNLGRLEERIGSMERAASVKPGRFGRALKGLGSLAVLYGGAQLFDSVMEKTGGWDRLSLALGNDDGALQDALDRVEAGQQTAEDETLLERVVGTTPSAAVQNSDAVDREAEKIPDDARPLADRIKVGDFDLSTLPPHLVGDVREALGPDEFGKIERDNSAAMSLKELQKEAEAGDATSARMLEQILTGENTGGLWPWQSFEANAIRKRFEQDELDRILMGPPEAPQAEYASPEPMVAPESDVLPPLPSGPPPGLLPPDQEAALPPEQAPAPGPGLMGRLVGPAQASDFSDRLRAVEEGNLAGQGIPAPVEEPVFPQDAVPEEILQPPLEEPFSERLKGVEDRNLAGTGVKERVEIPVIPMGESEEILPFDEERDNLAPPPTLRDRAGWMAGNVRDAVTGGDLPPDYHDRQREFEEAGLMPGPGEQAGRFGSEGSGALTGGETTPPEYMDVPGALKAALAEQGITREAVPGLLANAAKIYAGYAAGSAVGSPAGPIGSIAGGVTGAVVGPEAVNKLVESAGIDPGTADAVLKYVGAGVMAKTGLDAARYAAPGLGGAMKAGGRMMMGGPAVFASAMLTPTPLEAGTVSDEQRAMFEAAQSDPEVYQQLYGTLEGFSGATPNPAELPEDLPRMSGVPPGLVEPDPQTSPRPGNPAYQTAMRVPGPTAFGAAALTPTPANASGVSDEQMAMFEAAQSDPEIYQQLYGTLEGFPGAAAPQAAPPALPPELAGPPPDLAGAPFGAAAGTPPSPPAMPEPSAPDVAPKTVGDGIGSWLEEHGIWTPPKPGDSTLHGVPELAEQPEDLTRMVEDVKKGDETRHVPGDPAAQPKPEPGLAEDAEMAEAELTGRPVPRPAASAPAAAPSAALVGPDTTSQAQLPAPTETAMASGADATAAPEDEETRSGGIFGSFAARLGLDDPAERKKFGYALMAGGARMASTPGNALAGLSAGLGGFGESMLDQEQQAAERAQEAEKEAWDRYMDQEGLDIRREDLDVRRQRAVAELKKMQGGLESTNDTKNLYAITQWLMENPNTLARKMGISPEEFARLSDEERRIAAADKAFDYISQPDLLEQILAGAGG